MKELIDTIKKIEHALSSIEIILIQEYNNLLSSNTKLVMFELIKKKMFFKKYASLSKDRLFFEKEYGIFAPYKNNIQLNNNWERIVKKCFLLRELNLKNKVILNKKFYLNQYFLELFPLHKKGITYNIKGDLKN